MPPWRPPATSSPLASDAASLTPVRRATFVVRVRLAAEAVASRLDGRRCRRRPPSACLANIAAHAHLSEVDTASSSSEAALATYVRLAALASASLSSEPSSKVLTTM